MVGDANGKDFNVLILGRASFCLNSVRIFIGHAVCDDDGNILGIWSVPTSGEDLSSHQTQSFRYVGLAPAVPRVVDAPVHLGVGVVLIQTELHIGEGAELDEAHVRQFTRDRELRHDLGYEGQHSLPVQRVLPHY